MKHPQRRRRKPKPKTKKTKPLSPQPSPSPSPSTPTPQPPEDIFTILVTQPPRRAFWTPFSHASTELNLFARPDFERVREAIYQTFYIGSLFPNQNPPPVTLPALIYPAKVGRCPLKPFTSPASPRVVEESTPVQSPVQTVDRSSDAAPPPTPAACPAINPLQSQSITPLPAPKPAQTATQTPTLLLPSPANAPEDSPWASFTLSPKTVTTATRQPKASIHATQGKLSQGPLLEIFSAKVPMTPVRARCDSPYVSTREHSVHISSIAYAQDNGKGPQILCKAIINESYKPDVADAGRLIPTLTYVGFEYCDETCLTYVPIKDTRLVYRVSCRKERWFGEEVQMIMRRSVYERIKEMSIRAYLDTNPGVKIDCGVVEFQGVNVMLYVMVKSNRTVRIELDDQTVYRPLLETLNACKHDIFGEGLMHVRFSKTPGRELIQLRFILFGIQATRMEANKTLRIFQIAENERKDKKHNRD